MTVYLDTSVILSRLLHQPNLQVDWGDWKMACTSILTRIEFLRTIDRLRLRGEIDDGERVDLHRDFSTVWECTHRVPLAHAILERAAQPFPTVLGTLDALHLASALAIPPTGKDGVIFLTHDIQLGRAAAAMDLEVMGI